jgi:hypothetical protein
LEFFKISIIYVDFHEYNTIAWEQYVPILCFRYFFLDSSENLILIVSIVNAKPYIEAVVY